MPLQLTNLGPYQIVKPIGKGGMGSVYEATDSQTGQRVAIKALNPHLAQVEGFRERFEAEIESLKTLRHEGIVRLYGYGEQDGTLFYSMEIIDGPSLEDELKAGRRFNWREVTDIATQLCMALKHAHDHGIIHRDIKPANILFADEKRVKLADFGIARLFGTSSSLTVAGGVLGTAAYMSAGRDCANGPRGPAAGRRIRAGGDQHGRGGGMPALPPGRPPFRAKNLPEMLQLQRYAEPEPVSRYAADTPKQLDQVIAQLLAKDPADRFPNTQVLARHLQAMVRALSRPTPDGFALATDAAAAPAEHDELPDSIAIAVTRAEPATPAPRLRPSVIAAAESPPRQLTDDDATLAADEPMGTLNGRPLRAQLAATVGATAVAPAGTTSVFTTVEEEHARQQPSRSWSAVLAPLVSLVLFIAAIAGFGYYLTRPYTADTLYEVIASRANSDNANSLREVKAEIAEFIERFPDDERSVELRESAQRIEPEEMPRRLQSQARRKGIVEAELLPVEMLYLSAMDTANSSPQQSIALLESLVALYGSDAAGDESATNRTETTASERRLGCVALAKRQIESLREEVAKLEARQLASLQERLVAAAKQSRDQPESARGMYEAIVELHADDAWAAEAVGEARQQLEKMNAADE